MENTRATKEYKTKGGHVIVHKTYLTGREMNEIQKVMLKDVSMEMRGKEQDVKGFNATNITDLNNKTIELMVVSIDGNTTGILDAILDLPNSEYTEVIELVDEVTNEKKNV